MKLQQILADQVLRSLSPLSEVLAVFTWGSHLYNTANSESDWDFVVIVDKLIIESMSGIYEPENLMTTQSILYRANMLDMHIMTFDHYKQQIENCDIMALECFYQNNHINSIIASSFKLNLSSLRRRVSAVVSNSWVKAKKKCKQGDNYVGYKSLFHSIRILDYGLQIARYGGIIDYQASNIVWAQIQESINDGSDIDTLLSFYKEKQNKRASEFRGLCPLEELI